MGVYLGSYPMEIGAYKANTEVVLKPVTAKRSHQREKHTFVVSQGRPVSLRYVATFGREDPGQQRGGQQDLVGDNNGASY